MTHGLIMNIAAAVGVAFFGGLFAVRLKLPVIAGYLLAGMFIGPFTPGFIGDLRQISAMAEIGVIFLLFIIGVEFRIKSVGRFRAVGLFGTPLQVGVILFIGFYVAKTLGWTFHGALYFGAAVSITSTMVVFKLLTDRGEHTAEHGRILVAMLIVQDMLVVGLLVVLGALGQTAQSSTAAAAAALLNAALFVLLMLLLGTRIVPFILRVVCETRSDELFVLCAVGIALGTGLISQSIGLSAALGAFFAGLVISESEFNYKITSQVTVFRDVFASLFFVSVGMMLNPYFILHNAATVLWLSAVIVAVKVLVTVFIVLLFGYRGRTTAAVGFGMIPVGEFSFMLAKQGLDAAVLSETQYTLILCVAALTMFLMPVILPLALRVDAFLSHTGFLNAFFGPRVAGLPHAQDEALKAHAIIIGHGRVGGRITEALRRRGIPVVVIEREHDVVRALLKDGVPAICGDSVYPVVIAHAHPERARFLAVCLPDPAATRAVVAYAKEINPDIDIVVRVMRQNEVQPLYALGAREVVEPELEGALEMLRHTLRALSVSENDIEAEAQTLRRANA